LIRAGFTALGIFVDSVLGGQLSDDIAGMFSNIDSDSAVATVVSYAIIISICLTVASVASTIIRKVVYVLLMGWTDKLAGVALGVALGVVSGGVISAAIVMGMANLTYSSEVGDEHAGGVLGSTLDTEDAKKRLENGLTKSSLVETFIDVIDIVPAGTLWFVPTNFKGALDVLSQRKSTIGG
jgi:hypothetical protein